MAMNQYERLSGLAFASPRFLNRLALARLR
jgi:hypothetical protein